MPNDKSETESKKAPSKAPKKSATKSTGQKKKVPARKQAVSDASGQKISGPPVSESGEQLVIVGIGASAGGLEALKEMVGGLTRSANLTYVVAQHLSPTHTSLLRDLLKPNTDLAVKDLDNRQIPVANTIYVTPPNFDVECVDGILKLVKPRASVGPKPSVDHFFTSLAESCAEYTVGIILSGTGSDGALGVRAIKAAGGIALVQDPSTAKYDGMPKAAIQTGSADMIAAPSKIGEILENLVAVPGRMQLAIDDREISGAQNRLASYVKKHTGFDLSHYKAATVNRRLARRMALHKTQDIELYADRVKADHEEASQLAKDILISVTSFFRDPESFKSLRTQLEALIEERGGENVIRIWVPACATGEEAYAIAMLMSDLIQNANSRAEFLIFATDLDTDALSFARIGTYPDSAVDALPDGYRERFFDLVGRSYQVKKSLRQNMVFALQNVVEDPPFSRVDLISCRNLLIYFTREVQRRVLEIFHYAMRTGGLLFLGKSESIELHKELFADHDKKARIFVRRDSSSPSYTVPMRSRRTGTNDDGVRKATSSGSPEFPNLNYRLLTGLAERYCPPAVVINEQDEAIHFLGELRPFLSFPKGSADTKLYDLVAEEKRGEVRALIHRCRRERQVQHGTAFTVDISGENKSFVAVVAPIVLDRQLLLAVSFEPSVRPLHADSSVADLESNASLVIDELEKELASTRQHLQTVVEELETSNEELLSQSEELQSANEELQSTNEELQTSNEELQSTNEELLTVNDEMQSKSSELSHTASDLENVKESLDFPLLVVDERMHIRHFNNAASKVLPKEPIEPRISLSSIDWHIDMVSLLPRIRDVMKVSKPTELLTANDLGQTFNVRMMPAPGSATMPPGVVLTFVDVSSQAANERALREREALYRLSFELSAVGMAMLTRNQQFVRVNQAFCRILGYGEGQLLSKTLPETFATASRNIWKEMLEELLTSSRTSTTHDMTMERSDGESANVVLSAVLVGDPTTDDCQIAIQAVDITSSRVRQHELQQQHARLQMQAELVSLPAYAGDESRVMQDGIRTLGEHYKPLRVTGIQLETDGRLTVVASHRGTYGFNASKRHLTPQAKEQLNLRVTSTASSMILLDSDEYRQLIGQEHDGNAALVAAVEDGTITALVVIDEPSDKHQLTEFDASEFHRAAESLLIKFKEARAISQSSIHQDSVLRDKSQLQSALGTVGDGVIITGPAGLISFANSAACQLTGAEVDTVIGRPVEEVFRLISSDQGMEVRSPVRRCLDERKIVDRLDHTCFLIRADGQRTVVQCSAAPQISSDDQLLGAILIFRDLAAQGLLARDLSFRASHDLTTGLLNKEEFDRQLRNMIGSSNRRQTSHTLCLLAVDDFDKVLASCGREGADELMGNVGEMVRGRARSNDLVGRVASNEIAVLFSRARSQECRPLVEHLLESSRKLEFTWNDHPYSSRISAGVVTISGANGELDSIWAKAASARQTAEKNGGDRAYFSEPEDSGLDLGLSESQFVARLNHALDQNLFTLVDEPIFALSQDKQDEPLYRELLLQTTTDNNLNLGTQELIAAAERFGVIGGIDRWVIRTALREHAAKVAPAAFSINLSGLTISEPHTLPFLLNELENTKLPPELLIIELTETAAVTQMDTAVSFMNQLKERGVRFALDDFGSGMASFAYLRRLPVDFIKIDGTLVHNLANDGLNRTFVTAISQIGAEMGITVIAEMVVNDEIRAALMELGIGYGQGYFLSSENDKPRN